MNSNEVVTKRKELENSFREASNLYTGQLTNAKSFFDAELKKLQQQCPHMWSEGESAIQVISGHLSICAICRKKFN